MTPKRIMLNRLLVAAPWLTVLVLLGLSAALPNRTTFTPDSEHRKAEVAAALNAVPYFIGRWVGEDREVTREAQQLLRPNAIFSRWYQSPGDAGLHVLVVHCSDARDMIGHYPPICYPASGWLPLNVPDNVDIELTVNGAVLPVRQYMFQRIGEGGRENTIRIFNAFILPDGTVTRQIDDINRQSERLAVSVQGVAQLQVITAASVPVHSAVEAANELLGGMDVMFDALGVGQGASHET